MEKRLALGRHVSMSAPDYLLAAAREAVEHNYTAFMIYLGSPQSSLRPSVDILKVDEFRKYLTTHQFTIANIVVHGSYLVNLANTLNSTKLKWAIDFLQKDLVMMDKIGLTTIVIHPGSSLGVDRELALLNIANALNHLFERTSGIRIALETMSGRTNELGSTFAELKFILAHVLSPELVGVCWDTCHLYSAGYDIKEQLPEVISEFDREIGLAKLWVIHVNDSQHPFSARKDRHANIGKGTIGTKALQRIVHHPLLSSAIKLLETPRKDDYYLSEIELLRLYKDNNL